MIKYRNFVTTGEAKDQEWVVNNLLMLEAYIHDEMREKGFVPVLDHETDVKWWYIKDKGIFGFKVTIKGVKLGKNKAKRFLGIMEKTHMLIDIDKNPTPLQFAA